MPTLDWLGKKAVVNHHREVPTRLLHCDSKLSFGDPEAGNLLVQGDNLEALKALLPYYAGKVKCIYIDPPYNTGNEGWIYNDNVASPEIRIWLGKVVGKEAEDLSRHDKWLCMVYPRLRLLKDMLREDGAIFVSIDDNESHHMRLVLDEIFGRDNFRAQISWQRKYSVSNNAKGIAPVVDYVLAYAKSDAFENRLLPRSDEAAARYLNPDNDPRGPWKAVDYLNQASPAKRPNLCYDIVNPFTGQVVRNTTKAWKYEPSVHAVHVEEKRLWWGRKGENRTPALKLFLSEVRDGMTPSNLWLHEDSGHTDEAAKEIKGIFGGDAFDTPKPVRLIQKILTLATDHDSIVLDSFAGSGTTAHAVAALNAQDGGTRKFIMVETLPEIASPVTARRIRSVMEGYPRRKADGSSEPVAGLGGGYRFCNLGRPLFDEWGGVNEGVAFSDLGAFVFFSDTGSPMPTRANEKISLLGTYEGRAIHLLFSPSSAGVANTAAGNVLTLSVLEALPAFDGPRVVYAEGCTVPNERLAVENVVFKQVPYQLQAT